MLTTRLLFVALLVAGLVMCGVATAPAFAGGPVWLVNGKVLKAGETVEAEGHGALSFVVEKLTLRIECKTLKETMKAIGGEPGTDTDELVYSECSVVKPAEGCEVKEDKIVIESNTTLVFLVRKAVGEEWKTATKKEWEESVEKRLGDEFKAKKAGEVLGEVEVLSEAGKECLMKGKYQIKGTYTGIVNSGLEFFKESSKIKVNGPSGEFEGFATGFMEYFLVNEKGEPTGEPFQVSASAGGPHWKAAGIELESGESAKLTAKNLGDFTLYAGASKPTTVCTGLSAPTLLLGGSPGLSDTEILFSGCEATGSGGAGKCDALSEGATPGNIVFDAKDELVYVGTKLEAEMEEGHLGDRFTPAAGGNTFFTLEFLALSGATCPTGAVTAAVEGSVIGLVEPVNTTSKQGMLTFPNKAVEKAWQWLSSGKVHEVRATLKSFGLVSVTELGLADLELESGEEWGALTT